MLKSLKKIGFLLFTTGCASFENFVDSKIIVTKTSSLDPNVIETFSNKFKNLDLSGTQEIAKTLNQSIIKNSKGEFFLISKSQGKNNCFNMEKISIQDNSEKVKSFFFLENKLFALCLNGSTITIHECANKTSELDGDVLPLAKINFNTANSFSFNAANIKDFKKIQYNIWQAAAIKKKTYSSFELENLEFSFTDNIHCCSDCVIGNKNSLKKGCFILIQTEVKKGDKVLAYINLGLFFDGKQIVISQELASDNSFYHGNFNKFSITSLKSCGDTIVCRGKELKNKNGEDFSDFVIVGKFVLDSENNVCYKLISSHFVENLKDVTLLKTECENPIVTTIFVDNSNKVKFGTLVDDRFRSQNASDLVGIDFFKTNAELPNRTRLRDYNSIFVGDNGLLLQYKPLEPEDHSKDYLITLNELHLPMFS